MIKLLLSLGVLLAGCTSVEPVPTAALDATAAPPLPAPQLLSAESADGAARVLLVPLMAPAQQHSERLTAVLAELEDPTLWGATEQWLNVPSPPEWAFDDTCREVAIVVPRPLVRHDYRYALLLHESGALLLVRADGRDDTSDYFIRKQAEPTLAQEVVVARD